MQRHRVIVNIRAGTIVPYSTETIEVEPGHLYTRSSFDGSLRPIEAETTYVDGDLVGSGWAETVDDAYAAVSEALARQAQALNALRILVDAKREVVVHV